MKVAGGSDPDPELAARFAEEVVPLFDALARGARRLARTEADAEDLLQDTLLHAYTGFRTFKEGTNLKAWLFRILYNRWVSAHRRAQRRPAEVAVDEITDRDLIHAAAHSAIGLQSAEAQVLNDLPHNEVRQALAALPEGFTTALYYAEVQGYTYAETASIMNVPVGTVTSRVSRSRQRLRASLAPLARSRYSDSEVSQHIA
ncbi:sigma-70 family RNA polymerase sigma factor [Mycolicibacterium setense]|uniref:sigma-70 family RNA polymerase sigma factor n=1 Tax=Mycolicibacterium setense TaxID=431269 RepID=UPI0003A435A9|nr:sigma-70 family RNA polymerase sigma factor [Mycolicibacterium setense]KHO21496.1 RNA polymerase sigma 70 [Mycolicibacterium setense]MCV7114414.1 sigma-70 family RNA polymerase sigma factor [Mycolicibacterium setense]OBB15748.1 RNA polymerase subunit sigma-70 [Mycolicibacterium setense]